MHTAVGESVALTNDDHRFIIDLFDKADGNRKAGFDSVYGKLDTLVARVSRTESAMGLHDKRIEELELDEEKSETRKNDILRIIITSLASAATALGLSKMKE